MFVGTYELTIDAKNRISIPFAVRTKLSPERQGRSFYVAPGRRLGTLALYPDLQFEKSREPLVDTDRLSDEGLAQQQFEYSQAWLLDPDDQGRVLIPARLMKRTGIEREVVMIGVRDHLELWSKAEFEKFEDAGWKNYPAQRARTAEELKIARDQAPTGAAGGAN
ncbi:MAG: hypothetical protein U1D55_14275 [Phycisphaerae bacterium]